MQNRKYISPVIDHVKGFIVRDTYEKPRVHSSVGEWESLVWNRFNALWDFVNTWLASQDRVMTKDRILRMGDSVDPGCVLCGKTDDSRDHLFFMCPVAEELWLRALRFVGVSNGPSQWHMLIPWFKGRRKETLQTSFIAAAAT
ncbi:hypothetical protein QQ045_012408 [Rhodiola kirilowii]